MTEKPSMGKPEIEVKVRLTDRAAFAAKLPELGFRLKTPEAFERNVLYDTAEGTLRTRKELLRIREYNGHWKLTHKADKADGGAAERHKTRIETELEIGDGPALAAIFEHLGYRPAFVYEKRRTEWVDDSGHIVIDETPIGDFAELEGEHAWIDSTAAKLGISRSEFLTDSYTRLFWEWKTANRHAANNMTFAEIRG